jgi:hypothetical protein
VTGVNKIGRITPGGRISEFPIPTLGSGPRAITAGPDGNLWFTEVLASEIGRITPSGTISEFRIPGGEARPRGITAGVGGKLWFTEGFPNKIGQVQVRLLPAAIMCVVPKLRGKTLAQAKRLLRRAHCTLGSVTRPAKPKHTLVVVSQKPDAKKTLPSGAKVRLRLG